VGDISGHAHGHATIGRIDEQLGGAALKVAAEDVALSQVAGEEGGAVTSGDALGGAGPGQDDDLGHAGCCQSRIAIMSSAVACLRIDLTAMRPPSAGACYLSLSHPSPRMPASKDLIPCMPSTDQRPHHGRLRLTSCGFDCPLGTVADRE
jgi:hypothetical protein